MRGKEVSIFLIISIGIFSTITPVNAQDTNSIKTYEFDEGIELAKSTGKPIVLGDILTNLQLQDTINAELNNYITIDRNSQASAEAIQNIFSKLAVDERRRTTLLILDSDGREITSINVNGSNLIQLDSDGKEIRRVPYGEGSEIYLQTIKYAETRKGKIQRLPQEKGMVSVKDLLADYRSYSKNYYNYVIVSGFIRNIKSERYYEFDIDDGTGNVRLHYYGGLGDIKDGDKIFVKVWDYRAVTISKNEILTSTNMAKSDEAGSAKTPGFEILIGVVAIFFAWKKILDK